jgi:hypothetical protein
MWTTRTEQLSGGRGLRIAIDLASAPVSFAEVLRLWQSDAGFRSWFNSLLARSPLPALRERVRVRAPPRPFSAFRWETPPLTTATADRPFEFVLLDSPGLARAADPQAFADHFHSAGTSEVIAFPNLGRDAILIVPCPLAPPAAYSHLGAFVRHAPPSQQHALWQQVGHSVSQRLSTIPVWLSTAGAGVPWLHIRLDNRPKYYGYAPYRDSRA